MSFLLETKHKVFDLKGNQLIEANFKMQQVASKFWSPTLNFQFYWQPPGCNIETAPTYRGVFVLKFWVLGGLRDLYFQDTQNKEGRTRVNSLET